MSRSYSKLTLQMLFDLNHKEELTLDDFYGSYGASKDKKTIYNTLFRLNSEGLVTEQVKFGEKTYTPTRDGLKLLHQHFPTRDGVWKMIIFDIPESKRHIRNFLRAKLTALGFKRWQNSIWVSPYTLHEDFEEELGTLAKSLFIRLIKTTDINYTKDLDKLFPES